MTFSYWKRCGILKERLRECWGIKTTDCLTWANIIVHVYHKSMLQGNKGNCSLKTLLHDWPPLKINLFFFWKRSSQTLPIIWSSLFRERKHWIAESECFLWWHYWGGVLALFCSIWACQKETVKSEQVTPANLRSDVSKKNLDKKL